MKTLDKLKLKKLIKMALDTVPELTTRNMWKAVQTKGDWSMEEVKKTMDEITQKMHSIDPHIVVGPQQKTLEEVIENAERKKKEKEESECSKK